MASGVPEEDPGDEQPIDAPFVWHSADLGLPLVDLEDREALRLALSRPESPFVQG